jgi:hypothetical protein
VLSEPQIAALDAKLDQDRMNNRLATLIAAWQKEHRNAPAKNP